jgi:hypothetical protein
MRLGQVVVGPLLHEAGDARAAADRRPDEGDQGLVARLIAVENDPGEPALGLVARVSRRRIGRIGAHRIAAVLRRV